MKKRLFNGILAITCLFSMASCDGVEFINSVIEDGLLGNSTVYITNEAGDVDTLAFTSSVADDFSKTVNDITSVATIDLSANVDLTSNDLAFPFMAFQFADTTTGSYALDHLLTVERLYHFNFDTLSSILAGPSGTNLIVIAMSDTAWYISDAGNINVSAYPAVGFMLEGTLNNVSAYYITQSNIDRLNQAIDNGTMVSPNEFIHPVTMSGNFSSRRAAIIHNLVNNAFVNGGLKNKK